MSATAHQLAVSSGNERDAFSGGLFLVRDGVVSRVDWLPTAGLAVRRGRFYRVASLRQHDGAELLTYDERGVASYLRIDGLDDPHDVLVRADGTVVCVSAAHDAVLAVAPDGSRRALAAAGAGFDAWHVNCLTERDGRLYATAFGRFASSRGWKTAFAGAGMLFDVESGEDVVTGLTQPHTPRWLDGAWTICNSGEGTLVRVFPDGQRTTVRLGGFPRGLCTVDDRVYVGITELRGPSGFAGRASIAVLDRATWREIERIPFDGGNPYDLVPVDDAIAGGLQLGFRMASRRARNIDQLAMFDAVGVVPTRLWAAGDAVAAEDRRITITTDVPERASPGEVLRLACRVTNHGGRLLACVPPYPVYAGYRWFAPDGQPLADDGIRTPLPATLPPQQTLHVDVNVAVPAVPQRYTLVVSLVQETAGWFDAADGKPVRGATVEVAE